LAAAAVPSPGQAENVLLDEKDEPVVADFGLATASEEEDGERKTGIQGTLGHIAPGQYRTGIRLQRVWGRATVLLGSRN